MGMKEQKETRGSLFRRTRLSRRDLIGFAAKGAAAVVVTQSVLACDAAGITDSGDADTDTGGSASTSCVLTAALTEGPYFVDEKLERGDIRTDPVNGAVSAGVPLELKFNVMRVSSSACTPLTGAFLDVWHWMRPRQFPAPRILTPAHSIRSAISLRNYSGLATRRKSRLAAARPPGSADGCLSSSPRSAWDQSVY
jgi:hypothetical protein